MTVHELRLTLHPHYVDGDHIFNCMKIAARATIFMINCTRSSQSYISLLVVD